MNKSLAIILALYLSMFSLALADQKPMLGTLVNLAHPSAPDNFWTLNEMAGNTLDDAVGNNDATNVGGVWQGDALSITGTTNYIDVSVSGYMLPIATSGSHYSVSFWIFSRDIATYRDTMFSSTNTGDDDTIFWICNGATDGSVAVMLRNDAGTVTLNYVESTGRIAVNTWHHITWTDADGDAKLYIDGVLDATDFSYTPPTHTANVMSLGILRRRSLGFPLNGLIRQCSLYRRALLGSEVTQLYAKTYGVFSRPKTPALFASAGAPPADNVNPIIEMKSPIFGGQVLSMITKTEQEICLDDYLLRYSR